jgi:hypothetical protein
MSRTKDYLQDLTTLHWYKLHGAIETTASDLLLTALESPELLVPRSKDLCEALMLSFEFIPEELREYVIEQYFDEPELLLEYALWAEVRHSALATIEECGIEVAPGASDLLDMVLEVPGLFVNFSGVYIKPRIGGAYDLAMERRVGEYDLSDEFQLTSASNRTGGA